MKLSERLMKYGFFDSNSDGFDLIAEVQKLESENDTFKSRLGAINDKILDMDLALREIEIVTDKLRTGG